MTLAIGMMGLTLYHVIIKVYWTRLHENSVRLILGVFLWLFVMMKWSFWAAILTDPGRVPPYWGFYTGDAESKRKRYWLRCHIFKPDRCHHCNSCNRCVLSMDHHCPWINNWVGFYNRKQFLLLLAYLLWLSLLVLAVTFNTFTENLEIL